jgi:hypothetical protein
MNYNIEIEIGENKLATGASIVELPEEYVHFAHHDFDVVWNEETKRQEIVRGVHKFFGGMGEGMTCDTWVDALNCSLYDLYQVTDGLTNGDTFTATYNGETQVFVCEGCHVIPLRAAGTPTSGAGDGLARVAPVITSEQMKALKAIGDAIIETVRLSGPMGAPGGHIYAALMAHGVNIQQFEQIMSGLCRAGMLRKQGECYFVAARKA